MIQVVSRASIELIKPLASASESTSVARCRSARFHLAAKILRPPSHLYRRLGPTCGLEAVNYVKATALKSIETNRISVTGLRSGPRA
ncbi:hypothetical protein BF49_3888 [Bradyrhizobium sp.]|nr:hypothetical protein BF49_3888 [Bradyrhizobium sp.]